MQLEEIRKELPHGAMKDIAKSVGVSRATVSQFFSGALKPVKAVEILECAANIIRIKKERESKVMNDLKELCQ